MTGGNGAGNSPLINYAFKGLQRCWLPEHGRWSHIYHLDGREPPNESLPHSDVFYTLNVLLGCSRVRRIPDTVNVAETYRRNALQLLRLPVRKYAFGMAFWAAAELKLEVPADVVREFKALLSDQSQWMDFHAQDLGMILTGVVAQARLDPGPWRAYADQLFEFLLSRYRGPSGLFFDTAKGLRKRFASFATQTYSMLACYAYGEFANDSRAIEAANVCARKVIGLQGPNGEWPWFFDAQSGSVLDFYEVYSVHQYGMAPAFLECAERHNVPGVRAAVVKGFKWVFGDNQLRRPMLVPELHLSIRSMVRKGELRTQNLRVMRAVGNALLGRSTGLVDPASLELRLECRSYELGWILWSFGGRTDYAELTDHKMLVDALGRLEMAVAAARAG